MPNNATSTGTSHRAARRPQPSAGNGGGSPLPTGGKRTIQPMATPDSKQQKKAKKLLMDAHQLNVLQNDLRIVGVYVNSRHLEMLSPAGKDCLYTSVVDKLDPLQCNRTGIAVYQITKLMYNEEENSYEKLVSVYSALNSFGGVTALILQSDGNSVRLYLCTNTSGNSRIAGELLSGNLKGHFPGCEITQLSEPEKNTLLNSCGPKGSFPAGRTVRSLSMIPSRREEELQKDRELSAQGCEKFIDAMNGHKYTLVILSQCVSPDAMDDCREGLENLYTCLSPYAKETVSYGENQSDTVNYSISSNINYSVGRSISRSFGTSHTASISNGRSYNRGSGYGMFNMHFNSGSGTSSSTSSSTGTNQGYSTGESTSEAMGSGDSQGTGSSVGSNSSLTINRDNKAVQNLLSKLEEHIKRINMSQTFGMWNSCCYLITDDVATANMGTSTLAALLAGDSQAAPRAYCNQWDATNVAEREKVLEYLEYLHHPVIDLAILEETTDASGNRTRSVFQKEKVTPAMMISGKEIPTLMALPRKSVPGIVVDSMAEFGRNIPEKWKKKVKRPILFGNVYHMGQEEKTQTFLDLDTFASHTFICGASGSGKSNTTYNLLEKMIENKIPFLVIEPAKGEYKIEFAGLPNVNIFTADESPYRLLQMNPFEFSSGIHIREHLDQVLQVVSACWPLYGAMPGLLKKAFEQVYIDHGWDLEHSERIVEKGSRFPTFQDLVPVLERIIDHSPYSAQTKGDYKGALLNRISSLCNGFEGQIFGCSSGIPDRTLFNENTIVDLSSIGSDETRSLIMGILIIKLRNFRKTASTQPNSKLIHVTVLEEAHNILKRCSQETNVESGNVQGAAVGNLCRCIAEMRSAGEGFLIIDQSPGAVDPTAIKNTAIKIVMRLPAKDDCQEVGASLSLKEEQIRELSRLDVGVAAIFHAGWTDTLLAKMGDIWDQRYRAKAAPVLNKGVFTKVQGAVVQLMYHNLLEGQAKSIYMDVQELLNILCKESSALKPTLPRSKQQEMLDEVQIYLENNQQFIRANSFKDLQRTFLDFIFDFLRLDSVMRIFPLEGVNKKFDLMDTKLTPKETRIVLRWEKDIRSGICRYLYMPEECEPQKAYRWPLNPTDSECFWMLYGKMLKRYATKMMLRKDGDARYANALDYLNSIKFFQPSAHKGKR
ncbi:ATP-binding protein [Solibaculum mannosilyticum]|uniref:Helicase HerA central domain-containing protein n=1 Tax=Solibaculum mannosilyticum TaxID=2780922 RepID=A0A7I8D302_9FIRM|nr:ATP-binding protein [Solibaculum mannosilyticum]BCI60365.1 hypothetical protein C12CBH8_10040 [Solibaculum mannosilyticum]